MIQCTTCGRSREELYLGGSVRPMNIEYIIDQHGGRVIANATCKDGCGEVEEADPEESRGQEWAER